MKSLSGCCLLLLFSSLSGGTLRAQTPGQQAQKPERFAAGSSRVAPLSLRLYEAIPVSTHSDIARKSVELAIDKYENGLVDDAIVHAQHATEDDKEFALGYAVLSFVSRRTTPDAAALGRARALVSQATPDEQLLIHWMISVQEGNLLPAIMNMNDLIQHYPKNEHILYLTSEWLYFQQDYDRAQQAMENILQIDPTFSPALNILGHTYLQTANPDPAKAIATLKRYVELQPSQPYAEKSLGEVLSQTGDDLASAEHYGEALQLEPTYIAARVGLADTLTLLGDYSDAREQYDRAIDAAKSPRDRFHAEYQMALVPLWEGHLAEGRKSLEALAEKARAQEEPYTQFEIGFAQALLTSNVEVELAQLNSLQSSLQDPAALEGMTEVDRNALLSVVWRERTRVYATSGQAEAANQTVHELEELAARTRDQVVENIYESAHGYALFAQGDLANAANELATDAHNPLVLRQLILAQEKLGNSSGAEASRARLKFLRSSSVEWYLVARPSSGNAD
jgi:predicted Zn-dependent protease